jgi:hypothetical protein
MGASRTETSGAEGGGAKGGGAEMSHAARRPTRSGAAAFPRTQCRVRYFISGCYDKKG